MRPTAVLASFALLGMSLPVAAAEPPPAEPAPEQAAPGNDAPAPPQGDMTGPSPVPPDSEATVSSPMPAPEGDMAPPSPRSTVGDPSKPEPEGTERVPGKYIEEEPPEAPPEPIPETVDTLGGHLIIGAAGGLAIPFGSLQQGVAQGDVFSNGGSVAVDAGLGVSRTTVLGLYGDLAFLSADPDCDDACKATSLGVGAFVRYHLVQGLSFDPWASAGVGYRQVTFEDDISYTGLDFARLSLGGDWYFIDNLGIGPVLGLTASTFLSRSEGDFAGASVAMTFFVGGRLVFDAPGK